MSEQTERAIDKVTAHWKKTAWPALKSQPVPEMGIAVYWKRWTIAEQDACRLPAPFGLSGWHYISAVLLKALDEKGKPLFADADRTELETEADPVVIKRIGSLIIADLNGDFDAIKDAAKKG